MYASIRRYTIRPGATAQVIERVNEGFVPLVSRVPGFVAYYVVQTAEDVILTLNFFEDQEGEEESNRIAANWVAPNVGSLIAGLPQISEGEIVIERTRSGR